MSEKSVKKPPRCETFGCPSPAVVRVDICWAIGLRETHEEQTLYCAQHEPTDQQLAILRGIVTGTLPAARRPAVTLARVA
jgi:hypothetical protein